MQIGSSSVRHVVLFIFFTCVNCKVISACTVQPINSNVSERVLREVKDIIKPVKDFINLSPVRISVSEITGYRPQASVDKDLNITQLIRKYGYKVEEHHVKTDDGYILTMFRIPSDGPAIFLMHGLQCSSDDWVTAGPRKALAYLLAAAGFDVWLGNQRGNKHSQRHVNYSPDCVEFWDFTFEEIGLSDVPAMIDYVLAFTGQERLKYVGHSQGTTVFYVMCSERPEYNEKISLMVSLAPVAWCDHMVSPVFKLLALLLNNKVGLATFIQLFGYEFLPDDCVVTFFRDLVCGDGQSELQELICTNIAALLLGFSNAQLDFKSLPVTIGHLPAGSSTKQLVHYSQMIQYGGFLRFNYGKKNKKVYGTNLPPIYAVEKITVPIALFYSYSDWLSSVIDVRTLASKLPNIVEQYVVPINNFAHLDFLFGKNVKKLVYNRVLQLLNM